MVELFWPSETSGNSGASLTGTMSADRASGPTYESVLPVAGVPAPAPSQRPDPVAALGQFQSQALAAKGEQAPPFREITMKADGTFKMSGDQTMLADVMAQLTDLKTTKAAAMARVAQLKQQESSGSPILDALSQISGHLAANDPTMPGFVRALGAANLAMGPQGIRARREAEESRVAGLSKGIADLGMEAAKLSEYSETQRMKAAGDSLESRRVAVLEKEQARQELNTKLDNFRADLRPVMDVVGKTGNFNADQEAAIRQTAANHPDLPKGAVEAEIAKAKGNASARKAEIERAAAATRANIALRAGEYASRLAAQEGKQIRGQVVRANLAQAGKLADDARLNEKEALRLNGLNEMSIAADRMTADLEADPTWQGVVGGRIADTQLTTEMQKKISDSADLFVKKMSSIGLSFAKTSDAEMKKILATVPTATMTVKQAKRLLEILDAEGKRAAEYIGNRNWAETPEGLAAAIPGKYRDVALSAQQARVSSLSPQQRLAYGLAMGDEGIVQGEVERAIAGSPGGKPTIAPQPPVKSSKPGEFKMVKPKGTYPWEK